MNFNLFPKPDAGGWLVLCSIAVLISLFLVSTVRQDMFGLIFSGSMLCFVAGSVKVEYF